MFIVVNSPIFFKKDCHLVALITVYFPSSLNHDGGPIDIIIKKPKTSLTCTYNLLINFFGVTICVKYWPPGNNSNLS